MKKLEDLLVPNRYLANKKQVDFEMSLLSDKDKKYLTYLFLNKIKVKNTCNSSVAYGLGITDEYNEMEVLKTSGGSLPDI